ncbi:hypothetical protein FKP32DRAFT_1594477 [Trametes sanguinea]|nr:hypothetical protein FKP32DRAFT_1594477 [Trametes sanguinea]
MSLEGHWRQSDNHPFCDKCEKGFEDKRTFDRHTLVCELAVAKRAPETVGKPGFEGDMQASQVPFDVSDAEPLPASIAHEWHLRGIPQDASDDGPCRSTFRGSSPVCTSESSDTVRPNRSERSSSLLLSGPLSYDHKGMPPLANKVSSVMQPDYPKLRPDTLLASARREPGQQQQCMDTAFPPLRGKPDSQLRAGREDAQEPALASRASGSLTAPQLWSDLVANGMRPSSAHAIQRRQIFLQPRQDERPMLGERQERRQQPVPHDEQSASISKTPSPRTDSSEDGYPVSPIGSPPSRHTDLPLPRPIARAGVRPSRRANGNVRTFCGICNRRPCADPVLTFCGHVFCKSCILEELSAKLKCPTCKKGYFTVLEP